jgi:hypothetical protein
MIALLTALAFVVPGNGLADMPMSWFKPKPHHHKHHKPKPVDPRWIVVKPYNWTLDRIAYCESTNRWFIDTGNGYYGGLQFTLSTWWSVGGRGYPNQNSILEQKYRAVLVYKRAGYTWTRDWPVCGARAENDTGG